MNVGGRVLRGRSFMRNVRSLFGPICVVAMCATGAFAAPELKVGDPAPPFVLQGSDGKTYALADYKGRQTVVIAWFAKAFTGG